VIIRKTIGRKLCFYRVLNRIPQVLHSTEQHATNFSRFFIPLFHLNQTEMSAVSIINMVFFLAWHFKIVSLLARFYHFRQVEKKLKVIVLNACRF